MESPRWDAAKGERSAVRRLCASVRHDPPSLVGKLHVVLEQIVVCVERSQRDALVGGHQRGHANDAACRQLVLELGPVVARRAVGELDRLVDIRDGHGLWLRWGAHGSNDANGALTRTQSSQAQSG